MADEQKFQELLQNIPAYLAKQLPMDSLLGWFDCWSESHKQFSPYPPSPCHRSAYGYAMCKILHYP